MIYILSWLIALLTNEYDAQQVDFLYLNSKFVEKLFQFNKGLRYYFVLELHNFVTKTFPGKIVNSFRNS